MKKLFIVFTAIFGLFSTPVWAQSKDEVLKQKIDAVTKEIETDLAELNELVTRPDTSIITGHFAQALFFSMSPDAKFIGVYLNIDEGYKYTSDELVLPIKSYFDHYGLPVILVKPGEPNKGNGASMLVFVNGKCVWGDRPIGDFSLLNVQENHEQVFQKIKSCYTLAQKGLFGGEKK